MHPDRLAQIAPGPRTKRPTSGTTTTTTTKRKQRRPNALPTLHSQHRKPASINATKARLRSVRRFLQKNGASMPADQQVALEREQQDLERQVREAVVLSEGLAEEQQQKKQFDGRDQGEGEHERQERDQGRGQGNGIDKIVQKGKSKKAPRRTPKEEEMVRRYHKIRFFERKQATKHLRRTEALLLSATTDSNPAAGSTESINSSNDTSDVKFLTQEVHNRKVDLLYTQYFPLLQPYSSLYVKPKSTSTPIPTGTLHSPSSSSPQTTEAAPEPPSISSDPTPNPNTHLTTFDKDKTAPKRDHPIWAQVEERMQNGTLQELRDGPLLTKERVKAKANGINSTHAADSTSAAPRAPSEGKPRHEARDMPPPRKEPRNRREAREMARREHGGRNRRVGTGAAGWEQNKDQDGSDSGGGDGTQFFESPVK